MHLREPELPSGCVACVEPALGHSLLGLGLGLGLALVLAGAPSLESSAAGMAVAAARGKDMKKRTEKKAMLRRFAEDNGVRSPGLLLHQAILAVCMLQSCAFPFMRCACVVV